MSDSTDLDVDLFKKIAARFVFSGVKQESVRSVLVGFAAIAVLSILLIVALYSAAQIKHNNINIWMAAAIALGISFSRVGFQVEQRLIGRLLTLVGLACGSYALLHYPLMPVRKGAEAAYILHLVIWCAALIGAGFSVRSPTLATIPAAYIIWGTVTADTITGLPHGATLDIAPLSEVVLCLALGMALIALYRAVAPLIKLQTGVDVERHFSDVVLMLAVCVHLANYFISFIAKMALDGPPWAWLTNNNPLCIYLAAIDVGHITFATSWLAPFVGWFLGKTYLASNLFVLGAQAGAVAGFLMPKRALILLLVFFDVMHVAILVAAGANFWPWILLNAAIIAVIADPAWRQPRLVIGIIAALFIWKSQRFADVAWLGWFDTGANNSLTFWAEDVAGKRYPVSTNFFGFYSYPIAHFNYGLPDHERAFDTHSPNGGVGKFSLMQAAQRCDAAALVLPGGHNGPVKEFDQFLRDFNAMAIRLERPLGWYPYHLYAHHFFEAPSRMAEFAKLDKRRVRSYIIRRESVCLRLADNGKVLRKLVSHAEHRVPIDAR